MQAFGKDKPGIPRNVIGMWVHRVTLRNSVPRNPNGKGLPYWPEYDQKEGYLHIGATTQQAQRLKDKEVTFWTELRAKKSPQTDSTH